MVSLVAVEREKRTMFEVMSLVGGIGRALDEKDFQRAHKLRDELFTYAITEIAKGIDGYTKKSIREILDVLVGVDDLGV